MIYMCNILFLASMKIILSNQLYYQLIFNYWMNDVRFSNESQETKVFGKQFIEYFLTIKARVVSFLYAASLQLSQDDRNHVMSA